MPKTIIGKSFIIDGEVSSSDQLVIEGTVKGTIQSDASVVVDSGAIVEAQINSPEVEISGRLIGNVLASSKVELKENSQVVGNLKAPSILIADGASFKGNVNMDC